MADQQPTREQLDKVYEKVAKTYSSRPNVTGVDVGFRYKENKRTGELAVRVHVKEKVAPEALADDELLPRSIDGVPIDVIQAVYKPHAAGALAEPEVEDRKSRFDTLRPGISVSHPNVTSGTLGAVVYDRRSGRQGILSNWHVLVGSLAVAPGAPVVQPGRKHGGRTPRDRVATLERFMLDRHGDAAVALLTAERDAREEQLESGVHVTAARRVVPGERVEKSGARTGVTGGVVDGVGQYTVPYSVGSRTINGFKVVPATDDEGRHVELTASGDSGALWYAADDRAGVGLHFAGEDDPDPAAENALACHLPDVLEQLDVTLRPEGRVTPPPADPLPQEEVLLVAAGAGPPTPAAPDDGAAAGLMLETIVRLTRLLEHAHLTATDGNATTRGAAAPRNAAARGKPAASRKAAKARRRR